MGTRRILIVDGSADSRAIYRIMLQHHGYDVVEAADGAAALALLERQTVDAVVLELTLRKLDGHFLLDRLRSDGRLGDVRSIVVTARGLQEDRDRAEQAGCTRFLVKPLEPQHLLRELLELVPL